MVAPNMSQTIHRKDSEVGPTMRQQGLAGMFYATTSFSIMFMNKIVLTSYHFPSFLFLALCQFVATIFCLEAGKTTNLITYPDFDMKHFWKVFPLPFIFMLNTLTGLGGTQKISIPMFTVLRRFSIVFTMILEGWLLGNVSSRNVKFCVFLMVFGALVAAVDDLSFDMAGYTFIMINNLATAANGVVIKKKLESKELGTFGLMYYNTLFSFPLLLFIFVYQGEWGSVVEFADWGNFYFLFYFVGASVMGFVLNFSIFHCTKVNSALTTTVIGCLKNVLSTYIGMVALPDYVFTIANFAGVNVSIFGSLLYSYVKFKEQQTAKAGPALLPMTRDNSRD
ncbi:hypothetical protein SARC_04064 [Sphaeroforma arctica JP610]|uniref:Sugar phosphate transporter domain-containing protein n=1 Tax=Sphaeroforma arctica JP610 TaxID=667725 RepID=A0A0L0G3T3_9EUKA|nr:hypothetical protein SARC_04064 [Sphaeroforma arctica JP610]KNC83705.1 hypothetical protein SARC_04064 [Sphaeroforma arctica JP610]|eukprot:XP_014157607.1 hypothetical protein SARC_04064 [Sphaeroforma arctica JP610]